MNFKALGIPTHFRFRRAPQWIAFAVIAYLPGGLHAEEGLRTYIAPGITFMGSDDARVSEEGYGLSLGVGIAGDSPLSYEASLLLQEFEESRRNTPGWREWGVRGGVQYFFHRDAVADRFLDVGLSAVRTERTDINDATTSAALDFGIGLEHNILGSGTRLRGGVRYRVLFHDALSGLPEQSAFTFDEIGVHFGLLFGRGHGGGAPIQDQAERTQIFVYTSPETVRAAAEVGLPHVAVHGGQAHLQGLDSATTEAVALTQDKAAKVTRMPIATAARRTLAEMRWPLEPELEGWLISNR